MLTTAFNIIDYKGREYKVHALNDSKASSVSCALYRSIGTANDGETIFADKYFMELDISKDECRNSVAELKKGTSNKV